MPDALNSFYACELSQQVGEQLFATAPRTDVWLVLEYTEVWGNKAFAESEIPQPVQHYVNTALKVIPNSRLQLIKQVQDHTPKIAFYVALSREADSRMYAFAFDSYEALLLLDIPAIARAEPQFDSHLTNERLFLVCTNGRRDMCCSKFGFPLYQAIAKIAGNAAWETTHVGGHRFAANVVCLPHGLFYGRVGPGDVESLVRDYQDNRVHYGLLRGRSCYDSPAQAAEYFLRLETHAHGLNDFHLSSIEHDATNYTVTFHTIDNATHIIQLGQEQSTFEVHTNSNDPAREHVVQWHLIAYSSP